MASNLKTITKPILKDTEKNVLYQLCISSLQCPLKPGTKLAANVILIPPEVLSGSTSYCAEDWPTYLEYLKAACCGAVTG